MNKGKLEENLTPQDKLSINVSAYRLLYIYLLLCQTGQITFADLNTHFLNHPLVQRTFTRETLSKYLYTLQLFGCQISRIETQGIATYSLGDHPLKLNLMPDELAALQTTFEVLSQQPLSGAYRSIYFLSHRLCRIPKSDNIDVFFDRTLEMESRLSEQTRKLIQQFQTYCKESQVLELYCDCPNNGPPEHRLIEPHDVVYRKKRIFITGIEPKTNKKVRYDIETIRSHRQLPNRSKTQAAKVTVTFKLTGRVALNYRPYPGETILDKGEFLLVKHKTDEVDPLLRRLLKYEGNCQVISPNSIRKEMLQLIEHLLASMAAPVLPLGGAASTAQTDETLHKWACYLDTPQTWDDGVDG